MFEYSSDKEDFGLGTVVLENLKNSILEHRKSISTKEKLISIIEYLKERLEESKPSLLEKLEKTVSCIHDWYEPTWTLQERLCGYKYVYERRCKDCGYKDIESVNSEKDKPEWADNAYNNNGF